MKISLSTADKPQLVKDLEKDFPKLKFKGPYNDGSEWEATLNIDSSLAAMHYLARLEQFFTKQGAFNSHAFQTQFSLRVKSTHIGIDYTGGLLSVTVAS